MGSLWGPSGIASAECAAPAPKVVLGSLWGSYGILSAKCAAPAPEVVALGSLRGLFAVPVVLPKLSAAPPNICVGSIPV